MSLLKMGKRILVLATGNIYERRGLFNAVLDRTKQLKEICDYEVDMLLEYIAKRIPLIALK